MQLHRRDIGLFARQVTCLGCGKQGAMEVPSGTSPEVVQASFVTDINIRRGGFMSNVVENRGLLWEENPHSTSHTGPSLLRSIVAWHQYSTGFRVITESVRQKGWDDPD